MKVILTQDVVEKDRNDREVGIKVVRREGRKTVAFTEGAVVEMSEESGKKYIERGWAKEYEEHSDDVSTESNKSEKPEAKRTSDSRKAPATDSTTD